MIGGASIGWQHRHRFPYATPVGFSHADPWPGMRRCPPTLWSYVSDGQQYIRVSTDDFALNVDGGARSMVPEWYHCGESATPSASVGDFRSDEPSQSRIMKSLWFGITSEAASGRSLRQCLAALASYSFGQQILATRDIGMKILQVSYF
jgi:hypothetical protein